MFKFADPKLFISSIIVHKTILQKKFTQRPYGKQKKVNWILSFKYFRKVLFLVCVLFMSSFTGSRSIMMHSLYEYIIDLPCIQFFLSSTDLSTVSWVQVWLFSLQSKQIKIRSFADRPTHHFLGIKLVTEVYIFCPYQDYNCSFTERLRKVSSLTFSRET